jgi:iron complex outermembrane receptor protein
MRKAVLYSLCAVLPLVVGAEVAQAQESTDDGAVAETPAAATDGEILVTAQRRSERMQDVTASISAFGDSTIKEAGISSLSSIAPRVPGFYFGSFGISRPQLYIRGIGTRQFDPGSEASVGVFVDEIYLGRTGGSFGTIKDVERIEVLKGPQGTLYGRNTIAGAINVITKDPTDVLSGEFEAGIGNRGAYNLLGAISGPIAEGLSVRAVGWRTFNHGYTQNLTTGRHTQGIENYGGRLKLRWEPSDRISFNIAGEIGRDDGTSFQAESLGNITNPSAVFLGRPGVSYTATPDPYRDFLNQDPIYDRNVESVVGKADFAADFATITSITSYRHSRFRESRDFDFTPLDILRQDIDEQTKQFTQEIRITSDPSGPLSAGGNLDWIVGAFYYHDRSERLEQLSFRADSAVAFATGTNRQDDTVTGDYTTKSIAVFGQATYRLPAGFEVTVGARWTEDRKRADFIGTTTAPGLPLVVSAFNVQDVGRKWSSFDPKVVLAYKPNADLNIFASYGKGFKSGGFQYSPFSAAQAGIIFDPEKLNAYEVGVKSRWLDGRLIVNLGGFYYDYKNLQVSRITALPPPAAAATLITNAASSTIKGGEAEVSYKLTDGLSVDLAYAYTDAKYDDYVFNSTVSFSGTRMVRAPKHSLNLGVQNRLEFGGDSSLLLRADYAYLSTFYFEPGEGKAIYGTTVPLSREKGYGLLNLRATYAFSDWRVSLFMNNATDKYYRRTSNALPGQSFSFAGEPRSYGLTVGKTF